MAFDPDFDKVALLLHGDGADGSTAFTDSSQTPKVVSVASGAPRISTAQSKFGGASVHTNGGSIKATIPPLALRDFTVEFFVLRVTGTDRALFDIGNNQLLLLQGSAGLRLYDGNTVIPSATMLSTSSMEHVALVRQSGTFKLFHQGVLLGSATKAVNFASGLFTLGGWNAYASENLNGYFDEVRITDGVARYTTNFTPPTEPFPDTATAPALSAYAAAPTPLGAPAILAASIRQALASSQSPLGTPAILAASGETFFARAAAATPLGAPLALARAVSTARAATAGPLGAGAALGQLVAAARAMAVGPLGAPASLARTMVYAQASVPSPLGDPAVRANQPQVFARAQGFNSTAFGASSFATRLQAAGFSSTAFGAPSSPVPQTVVASGFRKTSLGWPFGFQYTQPKVDQVVSASPLATTQFGLPSAFIDATVQAAGSTSGQFGTPTTKIGLGAQAIAPATSWGAPLLLLSMRAQGFGSTSFGVPHAAMVLHAASTYRATRWGIPICVRSNTYLARSIASTPRFGRPTARKINAYQASSMAPLGLFGTPACALRYRALGIHGVARFGKPLLIRSAAC